MHEDRMELWWHSIQMLVVLMPLYYALAIYLLHHQCLVSVAVDTPIHDDWHLDSPKMIQYRILSLANQINTHKYNGWDQSLFQHPLIFTRDSLFTLLLSLFWLVFCCWTLFDRGGVDAEHAFICGGVEFVGELPVHPGPLTECWYIIESPKYQPKHNKLLVILTPLISWNKQQIKIIQLSQTHKTINMESFKLLNWT